MLCNALFYRFLRLISSRYPRGADYQKGKPAMRDATVAPPSATLPTPHTARTIERASPAWRARVGAYVSLMKPHVTVLLLGTTLAAMVMAGRGMPALGIV